MATGSVAHIRRAPGKLIADPTDLASPDSNYGGTLVGLTKLCALQHLGTPYPVFYEGLGGIGAMLEPDDVWQFVGFVREWDDDAIRLFFSTGSKTAGTTGGRYSEGGTTRHSVYKVPGETTPGEDAGGRISKWLYVPDDVVNVDSVLIYSGIATWRDGDEIALSRAEEFGMPFAIQCLRDAGDLQLAVGRLADLSLS